MITFSSTQRYFLYSPGVDMRKSYNGLTGIVRGERLGELMSGDVFVFVNRRRDQIKLLVWDRTGFVICQKRLEKGSFEVREAMQGEISWAKLMLILEGVSIDSAQWRKRYNQEKGYTQCG